jgi:hypothetical protein
MEHLLRRVIREHISEVLAENDDTTNSSGTRDLDPKAQEKLQALAGTQPSTLKAFADDLNKLTSVLKNPDIDAKAAQIDTSELKNRWHELMAIVAGLLSDQKSSSAEAASVSKKVNT